MFIARVFSVADESSFQSKFYIYGNETLLKTNNLDAFIPVLIKGTNSIYKEIPNAEFSFEYSEENCACTFINQIYSSPIQNIQYSRKSDGVQIPTNISGKKKSNNIFCKNKSIENDINLISSTKLNALDGPSINFTFTNNNTCSGTAIKFTSNVTGKSPFTYTWKFGDGQTSTANNPTHKYTSLGCATMTFPVSLTVMDADSISSVVDKTIVVKQQPDISFSDKDDEFGDDPFNNCDDASDEYPSYSITVNNDSKSTCINSYSIDWGDGSSTSDAKFPADHTYAELGAFSMVIRAKGSNGCDNDVLFVVKNQTNPSGGLTSPGNTTNLCIPTEQLEFTISGWGTNSPGTRYKIDYGDGSDIVTIYQDDMVKTKYYNDTVQSSSINYPIPHSYNSSNCPEDAFTIELLIINACDRTPATIGGIKVFSTPIADFIAPSSCANTNIVFTNKTIAGYNNNCKQEATYSWDFGDGSPIEEIKNSLPQNASATHTYTTPGIYNVTLTAKNSTCGETSKTKQITISLPPTASISGGADLCLGDTPPSIIFTGADGNTPYSFTYKINNGATQTVTTAAGDNSVTIQAPTNVAGTFTYSLTSVSSSSCSQSQNGTAVIIVNPALTATIAGTDSICLNEASPLIILTGINGTPPYTFTYNINGGTNQTITTTAGDTVTINVPTNSGGVFKYNLIDVQDAGSNPCVLTQSGFATITINDQPPEPMTLDDYEFCNGEITPIISFSNPVPATTYTWTNSNTSIGLGSNGFGNIPAFSALNNTPNSISTTITVTPSANGCNGESQTFTITVNSSTSVTFSTADQTICSGESTTEVLLSSSTAGADLSWTTEQPSGIKEPLTLSGTDIIQSQTYTNTSNEPILITYKAKATLSLATTCSGIENTYLVLVNPSPTILDNYADSICSGATFSFSAEEVDNIPKNSQFKWSEPIINPAGAITGAISKSEPQNEFSQTLISTDSIVARATYTIIPVTNDCEGASFEITITVIPLPKVNQPIDYTFCDGIETSEIIFTGNNPESTYNWSINNSSIGLPVTGNGNIPSFIPANPDSVPIISSISVTPSNKKCGGNSIKFNLTINPMAKITTQPTSSTVCLGKYPYTLTVSSKKGVGEPAYQWYSNNINSNIDGAIIPNETNLSFNPPVLNEGEVFYYCKIVYPDSCNQLVSEPAKITVYPNPVVHFNNDVISDGGDLKFCQGDSIVVRVLGAQSYKWNDGSIDDSLIVDDIGNHSVIATSKEGCSKTVNFSSSYFGRMYYSIQSDKEEITNFDNSIHFWSDDIPNSIFEWDFGDGTIQEGVDLFHSYEAKDGYYDVKLKVINPFECIEEITKRIWVKIVSLPNTFSPNGDGINDLYLKNMRIEIYNRNGILFYEGEDGWDGNYKGNPVANDTYFVIMNYSTENGTKYETNYVTVLR